jgi:Cupin
MSSEHDSSSAVVSGSSGKLASSIIEQSDPARTAQGPDTLSDVLREVRLAGSVFFLVDALTPWVSAAPAAPTLLPAVLPHAQHLISYHVIREGRCWCRMPGQPDALLEAGDVLVVPHGDAYTLSSDRDLEFDWPLDVTLTWFRDMAEGRSPFVITEGGNGPDRLQIVCGFLGCDMLPFNPVLAGLPRLLRPVAHQRTDVRGARAPASGRSTARTYRLACSASRSGRRARPRAATPATSN